MALTVFSWRDHVVALGGATWCSKTTSLLDYKFELLSTIHTDIVAVAEWYNFRIPTGYGPRNFPLELVDSAGGRRFKSHLRATWNRRSLGIGFVSETWRLEVL